MRGGGENKNSPTYVDDGTFDERVRQIAKPKVDFVLEVCGFENLNAQDLKNKIWVDIGSGGGQLLSYIKSLGLQELGIEAEPLQVDYCKKRGLNAQIGFLDPHKNDEKIAQILKNADIVSLITVLEHIEQPQVFMNYLASNMKKDSILVIEVPRHPSFSSFVCATHKDFCYRHISLPQHLQIFSEKSFDILIENKFELIGKWGFGQGFSDIINAAIMASDTNDDALQSKIMQNNNAIQKIIDESGLSDEMIFVARKL